MPARVLAIALAMLLGIAAACGDDGGPPLPDTPVPDDEVPIMRTEAGIEFVRTPDERFEDLPGYPFEPNYVMIDGLRMHYVDEGPDDGEVILLLHGEPSWSYLYRKMIPPLAEAGHRVIALDMMGMGRSDKPIDLGVHTYAQEIVWVTQFIDELGLRDITLFAQDWGGLIGLRVVGDQPDRFARVVAANTRLPIIPQGFNPFRVPDPIEIDPARGSFSEFLASVEDLPTQPQRFQAWIEYSLTAPDLRPSEVVDELTATTPSAAELAAYDAPYPSLIYKAAIRAFPSMIAAVEDENVPAWEALGAFEKPFLSLGGTLDENLGSQEIQDLYTNHIPGTAGQPHERLEAHHFIQEDIGELLAERVNEFIAANP